MKNEKKVLHDVLDEVLIEAAAKIVSGIVSNPDVKIVAVCDSNCEINIFYEIDKLNCSKRELINTATLFNKVLKGVKNGLVDL